MRYVLGCAVVLGLAMGVASALAQQADADLKPVVGFVRVDAAKYFAEEQRRSPYGTRVLAKNGFRFGLYEWRTLFGVPTTEQRVYDLLRQFNVAVIDVPYENSIMDLGPERRKAAAEARAGLERYVNEGGSVLLILQAVRYASDQDQDYTNLLIQGLGVQMLHEGVFDAKCKFTTRIADVLAPEGFFWTENITPGHPVTMGVRRLCLPEHHSGRNPGVVALKLSEDWRVLVRGQKSAQSYRVTAERETDYASVSTYKSAPPIAAARTFGKGRVVAYSVPTRCAHENYGVPGWRMIVEETGNAEAGLPSDSGRLVLNAIKWLTETSRGNPKLGIFTSAEPLRVTFPKSVEYDKHVFPKPVEGVRGIVGAKTALSDGKGRVADYARAAKAAGLSFVVFNESLEDLTAKGLEQLKAECKKASDDTFYACPGVEFTDDLDNRWAIWSERIAYPPTQFNRCYGKTTADRPPLKQWDGKVMQNPGQYWHLCGFSPNALLTYGNLRAKKAHPANMWWFFRVAPLVYTGDKLVEDNRAEFLWALRNVRAVDPVSYTRIYSPDEVAEAAGTWATAGHDLPSMRKWLNGRCANYGHAARPYATQGPSIRQWEGINSQFDLPLDVRGVQRTRLRFEAASPAGIREVKVHDAGRRLLRRFLGHGKKTLVQEFELVHDKDHYPTLEVVDTDGKVAISHWIYMWNYKTTLFRCADNLNFLNGVGLVWHPWNQMMPLAQYYQGSPGETIRGYDTAAAFTGLGTLNARPLDVVRTAELKHYPVRAEHGTLRKVLDVLLPGNDVKICQMTMGPLVEPFDTLTRDTPTQTSVPAVINENELFTRMHRATYFQNRANMFIKWNYRRAREGAENYRGGIVWHEGTVTFKRDATLAGRAPISLLFMAPAGKPEGTSTHILVKDAEGGAVIHPLTQGKTFYRAGMLAPGGYLSAAPCDRYVALFAPADSKLRYVASSNAKTGRVSQLVVGVGENGRKVKAGDTISYGFAMATLGGPRIAPKQVADQLEDLAAGFGIGGKSDLKVTPEVGTIVGREMFQAIKAKQNECQFRIAPRETIIDLPVRVEGVQDNGCAAVHSTARPWLRWIGVADGTANFQENVDKGSSIWAGNVFRATDKRLRLTLTVDGQAAGKPPLLEVHNPTDAPIRATVSSPPHCPRFGGMRLQLTVPAGSSVTRVLSAPVRPAS